jgi:hypothetical protein
MNNSTNSFPMSPPSCAPCAAGPAGIVGHDDMRVKALGGQAVRFECTGCRTLWSRTERRPGTFAWSPVDRHAPIDRKTSAGIPVPTHS